MRVCVGEVGEVGVALVTYGEAAFRIVNAFPFSPTST